MDYLLFHAHINSSNSESCDERYKGSYKKEVISNLVLLKLKESKERREKRECFIDLMMLCFYSVLLTRCDLVSNTGSFFSVPFCGRWRRCSVLLCSLITCLSVCSLLQKKRKKKEEKREVCRSVVLWLRLRTCLERVNESGAPPPGVVAGLPRWVN